MKKSILIAGSVLSLFILVSLSYQPIIAEKQNTNQTSSYWGVIIGISDYNNTKKGLDAPANDSIELYNVLIDKNKQWTEENLLLLIDKNATRENILNALEWLKDQSDEEDIIFFSYCGHGINVEDQDGDEQNDPFHLDEAIVSYDRIPITDDELGIIFDCIGEKEIEGMYLVFTACKSGGLIDKKISVKNLKYPSNLINTADHYLFQNGFTADIKTSDRVILSSTHEFMETMEFDFENGTQVTFLKGVTTAIGMNETSAENISKFAIDWWYSQPTVIGWYISYWLSFFIISLLFRLPAVLIEKLIIDFTYLLLAKSIPLPLPFMIDAFPSGESNEKFLNILC